MQEHTSPLDISSLINVQGNENQEAFVTSLSNGGALFLLGHRSILFISEESVIKVIDMKVGVGNNRYCGGEPVAHGWQPNSDGCKQ